MSGALGLLGQAHAAEQRAQEFDGVHWGRFLG